MSENGVTLVTGGDSWMDCLVIKKGMTCIVIFQYTYIMITHVFRWYQIKHKRVYTNIPIMRGG